LAALTGAALLVAYTTPTFGSPIVFDFEDGLQGWELHGAATRVQTQLLGGEWAIFGDGFVEGEATSIAPPEVFSLLLSLGGFASVSWDTFFIDGDEEGPWLVVRGVDLIENIFVGHIEISWLLDAAEDPSREVVAFIDNITFHPVPEPTTFGLLGLGVVGLAVLRRR
jgi:hypothetical protein